MAEAKNPDPSDPQAQKRPMGRPKNTESVTLTGVKVSVTDYIVLEAIEDEIALAPEETMRVLAHLAMWQTPHLAPDHLRKALNAGLEKAKKSG